jgi:hypothetical protein
MEKKVTPYDTGKVKIGVYYQPPRFPMEDHELVLQDMLLGDSTFVEYREPWYRKAPTWFVAAVAIVGYVVLLGSL